MTKLRRKQRMTNVEWIEAVAHIEELVSREEIDNLASETVAEIQSSTGNKKAAYAWSGGKDSIVLSDLCERAGITNSMIGVCRLEYPAFMQWVSENRPEHCEIINTDQDLDWLAKHPDMLFPRTSHKAAQWFSIIQHRAQCIYYKAHNLDVILLGRRRADGNFVGRSSNIYTDGKGVTRYSPLAAWKHEHLLAYIHYNNLTLPPIYEWPNGYKCGTHPWPARQWTADEQAGWSEIFSIDPSIVEAAAEKLPGARAFLEVVSG